MKNISPVALVPIDSWSNGLSESKEDLLAVEEPLQIKLQFGEGSSWQEKSLTVTMRTPGHDFDLASGFLFAENIIQKQEDIMLMRYCHRVKEEEKGNVLIVKLSPSLKFNSSRLERNFFTHSSCGVCGKTALSSVVCEEIPLAPNHLRIPASLLKQLNQMLMEEQTLFKYTGSIHASAVFQVNGKLLWVREDVGRHNALDKVIGAALQNGMTPLSESVLMLSGRVSFELVQKTVRAGIPIVAAVGAPSSLAVDLAKEKNITLIGFLKNNRFNIYSGKERIILEST